MATEDIQELRRRMVAATDLSEFHHYYVANFLERDEFRRMGRPLRGAQSDLIVRVCVEVYLGRPPQSVVAIQANLTEVPEFRKIYGALSLDGKITSVLYFEDLDQGLVTVIEDMETLDTEFMQFHLLPRPKDRPN
jgi:hypothetical protein